MKKARKNELSADQAALILSQVNHKIKIEEIDTGSKGEETIINLI